MIEIIQGDWLGESKRLADESVRCCVTSPPYWKQRDYGHPDQLGQEATPEEYISRLVEAFREVKRVLKHDGTLWLNIDDTYRNKQLLGIPWRLALALQEDGWLLRCDNIWHKTSGMREAVTDRPTRMHEYLFLLSKRESYYYNATAIREESAPSSQARAKYNNGTPSPKNLAAVEAGVFCGPMSMKKAYGQGRNKTSVWSIATQPYKGAHFAPMPSSIVEVCIKAGSAAGNTILDPFAGTGTVGKVALELGRKAILVELNSSNVHLINERCTTTLGLPGAF